MAYIKDRWFTTVKDEDDKPVKRPTKRRGTGARWQAVYADESGREHSQSFRRKVDAQAWLVERTSALVSGTHVAPRDARMTVGQWCETWLEGYATRRPSTVRQARVHIRQIKAEFGRMQLSAVRPSHVKSWTSRMRDEGKTASYVYALHNRLSQIMADAVHDGVLARNPCSRRTSPGGGSQRPYVATTKQVWALHDAMPADYRPAVLLGAFAGLRISEVCGLRVADVDFMRGVVTPAVQYPAEPLKTPTSRTPVPIPRSLASKLASYVADEDQRTLLVEGGRQVYPWRIERALRSARERVEGLPAGFRHQDLRHYFASLLIASGADVKVVQTRVRHASAKTTLDVYGHLFRDADESTREAVESAFAQRTTVHTRSTWKAR